MAKLMDIDMDDEVEFPDKDVVDKIMSSKWSYSQTYSIGSAESVEERQPVWLVYHPDY